MRSRYGPLGILVLALAVTLGASCAQADEGPNPDGLPAQMARAFDTTPPVARPEPEPVPQTSSADNVQVVNAGTVEVVGMHMIGSEVYNISVCSSIDGCALLDVQQTERRIVVFKCDNGEIHYAEVPDRNIFEALGFGARAEVNYATGLYGTEHHDHWVTRIHTGPQQ